jgi:hypothetical protein
MLSIMKQPDALTGISMAMCWDIATSSAAGYDEISPLTASGMSFSTTIALPGVGVVVSPATILAADYPEDVER